MSFRKTTEHKLQCLKIVLVHVFELDLVLLYLTIENYFSIVNFLQLFVFAGFRTNKMGKLLLSTSSFHSTFNAVLLKLTCLQPLHFSDKFVLTRTYPHTTTHTHTHKYKYVCVVCVFQFSVCIFAYLCGNCPVLFRFLPHFGYKLA